MNIRSFLVLILFFILAPLCIAETIVFEGTPIMKNVATIEESFNDPMNGEARIIHKVVITKEKEGYIWFSREKKNLEHFSNAYFDLFINSERGDYVKISKAPTGSSYKYLYMEHLTDGMKTITYWGFADKFRP